MSGHDPEAEFVTAISALKDAVSRRDRPAAKLAMVETVGLWPACWHSLKEAKASMPQALATSRSPEKETGLSKRVLPSGTK